MNHNGRSIAPAPPSLDRRRLDDVDHRILAELSHDGRLSNTDLARRIGLSASACWTRVHALEESGVIKGYTAIIDRAAIGLPETVVVEVTVESKHAGDVLEGFEAAIERMPKSSKLRSSRETSTTTCGSPPRARPTTSTSCGKSSTVFQA